MVRAARAAGRLAAAVTIGVHRPSGAQGDVVRSADVMLPGPAATGQVLRALARLLEAEENGPLTVRPTAR